MTASYWRLRTETWLAEMENQRVARLRALDEALTAVRQHDEDVLDAEDLAALNRVQEVVNDLRRVW